jgi:hypothetical protein
VTDQRVITATDCETPNPADGLPNGFPPQQVTAVALLQHVRPRGTALAKVVKLPVAWRVDWDDPERQKWHRQKMESKVRDEEDDDDDNDRMMVVVMMMMMMI